MDTPDNTQLLTDRELDREQRRFRKLWRRQGGIARFFRVVSTGDVVFTIDRPGDSYSATLARTLDNYWRLVLADREPAGGVQ